MSERAAVIGGGITGLSLAYFLLKQGIRADVFEKQDHLGGLAAAFKPGGAYLERFYHHFFAGDTALLALLEELGLKDSFYWSYPAMGFFHEGRIHAFTTPLDLLAFSPLPVFARFRLGLFGLRAKKDIDWRSLETITAEQWLKQELGEKIYQVVWRPMLRAKFGAHAASVPAAWLWSRLHARSRTRDRCGSREKLGYLRGSTQVLINALDSRIKELGGRVRLNCQMNDLPMAGYDRTIVTAPQALPDPGIEYLGNICVVLKLKQRFSGFYWVNIADERVPFCALLEQTNAFADQGYGDDKYVYLSYYVDQADPIWQNSDREVLERSLDGMRRIKPEFSDKDVIEPYVFRERYAQPLPGLEHSRHVPPFKLGPELYLVSNAQIYPEDRGINNSIRLAWNFVKQLSS